MADDMLPIEAPQGVNLDRELERWADDDIELQTGGGWVPTSTADAEWAALKMKEARDAFAAEAEHVIEYERRVEQWKQHVLAPLARRVEYFEDRLRRFGLGQRAAGLTKGHVYLPSATIKTVRRGGKAKDPKLVVERADALDAYARKHQPDALVVDVKLVQWVAVDGKPFDEHGNLIDGCRIDTVAVEPEVFTATVEVLS